MAHTKQTARSTGGTAPRMPLGLRVGSGLGGKGKEKAVGTARKAPVRSSQASKNHAQKATRRAKSGTKALRDIRRQEIAEDFKSNLRFQQSAILALQEAAECFLIREFEKDPGDGGGDGEGGVVVVRWFETTQHLLNVTKTLESIQPGGQRWLDYVRVRLLHASVRSRILGMAKTRPSYYDVESCGIPINNQETIATIATYSSQALWLALPSQGIYLKQQEIEDYIQLSRLVGYFLGTPTNVFKTAVTSKAYFDSVLEADVKPTEISKVLANNIITSLTDQPPHYPSKDFLHAQSRMYNGEELCDALAIPKASYLGYVKAYLQVVLLMTVGYLFRSFLFLDKWRIRHNRKSFWEMVITGIHSLGRETNFKMQYVPDFDAISKLEKVGSGASVVTMANY
ncbi:hypothetical protein GMDG_08159 [Pseudogymnoascus destructans 20631-21]|uniref:ER-bound oxygenase mpaB/mpaB'/Rubber oxygenase catalytic domain-containing protein n=1 Tax=Pseudogymnoascus destructans (strain ATCC MYA-4855 / 20631-21) TaxID=658429 RepID=L8G2F2_PSED2|nr:hypothetical protein GMDG_08159 [Pseudogymnoascus destructans 20631-21]